MLRAETVRVAEGGMAEVGTAEGLTADRCIRVWADGPVFRWVYEEASPDGQEPLRLPASTAFPDEDEAVHAATTAFPGVPVRDADGHDLTRPGRRSPGSRRASRLRVVAAMVAVLLLVYVARRLRERPRSMSA